MFDFDKFGSVCAPNVVPLKSSSFRWILSFAFVATSLVICAPLSFATDDAGSTDKPGVLLQAGISHSAFLPPLKMDDLDKQISPKTPPVKAPQGLQLPQPTQKIVAPPSLKPTVKDPAQALRKELGNLEHVDRATAYQKLLNLSAQKGKKSASTPIKGVAVIHREEAKTPLQKPKVETVQKSEAQKFEVPDWLAGVWQRTQMTETKRISLPSNKSEKTSGTSTAVVTDAFGTYRDKNGHIYQLFDAHAPAGRVDRGATIDIEHVFDYRLKILDSKRALVQAKAWHVQIGKFDKRLITAYQDEEFNVYTLLGPGKLRTDSSVKVFDKSGNPTLITQSFSNETRIRKP
ncbi:MAG: hypothetical protein P4L53_17475 [Candidatus Obscuribacterales bacterium]|nr:hypothetical protein [Candidatus Obscuribacterales bacterium]